MLSTNHIPEGWVESTLGSAVEILSSKRIFAADYVSDGIPFYRSKEIIEKSKGGTISTPLFITEKRYNDIKEIFGAPVNGDLLISAVGDRAGIPYYIKDDGDFYFKDGNLIWFRNFNEKLSSHYLCYFLKSRIGQYKLDSLMIGSAQKALTIVGIKSMKLLLPPLPEQKAIANVLTAFDDKIELLQAQNKTLETMAQTIFKEWFGKYQIEDELPEGWRVGKLGEIVTPLKGKNITKKQVITGKYPVIAGGLKPSVFHNVCNTKSPVLTVSASGANAGYVALHHNPVWSSDSTFIDISFTDSFYFIYVFLKNNQSLIFDKQEGSAIPHVYPRHLENLDIVIPNFIELEKYEKVAENFFNKISNNTSQILSLTKTRDTLLPKLMSGQVRVNHQKLQSS